MKSIYKWALYVRPSVYIQFMCPSCNRPHLRTDLSNLGIKMIHVRWVRPKTRFQKMCELVKITDLTNSEHVLHSQFSTVFSAPNVVSSHMRCLFPLKATLVLRRSLPVWHRQHYHNIIPERYSDSKRQSNP